MIMYAINTKRHSFPRIGVDFSIFDIVIIYIGGFINLWQRIAEIMAENIGAKMADDCVGDRDLGLTVTMCDVLEEEKELEDDANAVLGDCDDTNCTYNAGYVPRQALYACATCTTSSDESPGGVCLACSYACHEGHDLVELYTKRHFRCDCGNKKFPNNACRLCPVKEDINCGNGYNQNFKGVYCDCSRPYPDDADETVDEMIQCICCEDWYHGRHIGAKVPDNEDYEEMICTHCMKRLPFLYAYKDKLEKESIISVTDEPKVEPIKVKSEVYSIEKTKPNQIVEIKATDCNVKQECPSEVNGDIKVENNDDKGEIKKICFFKCLKNEKAGSGPGFFPEGWRSELCICFDCKVMYEQNKCLFLIDVNDTIKAYEERGKTRNGNLSQYDKGMSALSQLDRVKQMEAIRGYKNMKDRLKEYLQTFAREGRTVEAKDIHDFFEDMQKSKRRRIDMPFFCH